MFGNLIRESGVVPKLVERAQNLFMYIITIVLGLKVETASGVLFGKVMYKLTNGKINPMIRAAGVIGSAVAAGILLNMFK